MLLGHKNFSDRINLRHEGNAFVDLTFPDVREGIDAADVENQLAILEAGFDSGGADFPRHGLGILEGNVPLLEIPGDAPVHRAGVDVGVTKAPGKLPREGAFAGGGGAINGDNGMRLFGHERDR